ncbi:MAG: Kazal-type serine protease inhibitor [Motiliproteus sp.]
MIRSTSVVYTFITRRTAITVTLAGLLLGGCTAQSTEPDKTANMLPDGAVHCPTPKAESAELVACTMNYQPVCGVDKHGIRKARTTYGNACGACAEPDVIGYTEGPCP